MTPNQSEAPPDQAFSGPLEVGSWPSQIQARVITPGPRPCIHGYDVESDLARQFRFTDIVLLSLTGELPTEARSRAFDVVMSYLLPLSVAHAPTHATVVARLCGAKASSMSAVAATALAEHARYILDAHVALVEALERGAPLPECAFSSDQNELESVRKLDEVLRSLGVRLAPLSGGLSRIAAMLVVLHFSGLVRREQMESVIVLARIPSALAEGFSEKVANFREYPINLPRYDYEESP